MWLLGYLGWLLGYMGWLLGPLLWYLGWLLRCFCAVAMVLGVVASVPEVFAMQLLVVTDHYCIVL